MSDDVFDGEDPRWEKAYCRAASGTAAAVANAETPTEAAKAAVAYCTAFADATVRRLDERKEGRQQASDQEQTDAEAKVRAQGTYEDTIGHDVPLGTIWTVEKINGDRVDLVATVGRQCRDRWVDLADLLAGKCWLRPTTTPTPVELLPELPKEIDDAIGALLASQALKPRGKQGAASALEALSLSIRRALVAAKASR